MAGAAAFSAHAAVVLNEPFTYADGALITVSSGLWSTHSGNVPGQVDVASGKVNLSQSETEDVNAPISGSPYSSGNLYASFVVNFSTLPSGSGTYFAHFKDATTSGFRGRVFAQTTGAAAGQFRLGVANSSGPAIIQTDLSLNTDYIVVMRYDTAAATSTLWINPGSETATSDRADAVDSIGALAISTFGLRQATAMGILTLDNLKVGTAFADVAGGDPTANPPVISNIPDQSIPANGTTGPLVFNINDGETPASSLVLSKASSNTALVPNSNITFAVGPGTERTVTVTPAAGQQGSSTITVTVTDGNNNTANRSFVVVVGAPSISAISNQTTPTNAPSAPIAFTVSDNESPASSLIVSAFSSNESLVPSGNIFIGGSGSNRTAVVTPAADQAGIATITIVVSDGINSTFSDFIITVYPVLGLDIQDTFSYPDGSVTTGSSFTWNTHSASTGQTGQTVVASGQLLLSGSQSEDIHTFLTRSPYDTNSGAILYSSFTVNFSELPTATGSYFAHFRDTSSGFRARVYASTTNAASGSFRLGISNSGNTFDVLPTDLSLGTTYTVVTRYNVGTGESTLWVNPSSEASPSVSGTDSPFVGWIWTYAFRQSSGMGSMAIDNLKVGTAFSEVFDASAVPATLNVAKSGSSIQISWTTATAGYVLQSTGSIGTSWSNASETPVQNGNTYTVTINGPSGNQFYRLIKP